MPVILITRWPDLIPITIAQVSFHRNALMDSMAISPQPDISVMLYTHMLSPLLFGDG